MTSRTRGVSAFTAGCTAILISRGAWAGEPGAASAQGLQEVVITGSRVIQYAEEATGPVTILERTDLERAIPGSVGEILQSLPLQNGATENLNNNDAAGATRVNLRGLGPERTLVLLNGRRFIFGGLGADSSVNLDMIPLSMIERVEIATSGATSIYGSDAVAGVVNIVTRQNFSGADAEVAYRSAERGDGGGQMAHALLGSGSDRGNFVLGVEYDRQDAVRETARPYSAHVESLASPNGPIVYTGALNSSGGLFVVPAPNSVDPSGLGPGLYTRVAGASGRGPDAFRPWDAAIDLFNYAPYAYLQTPSERGIAWLAARHDIGASVEWFVEGLIHHGHTQEGLSPATYSSFNNGAAPLDPVTGAQFIPATNFYNPFGTDLIGVLSTLEASVPRAFAQHVETDRAVAGLRGRIGQWHWDGSLTRAQSVTRESQTGAVLRAQVRNAVGPSGPDDAGHIVCGQPDAATGIVAEASIVPGCVPLDLFGGPQAVTPQQLDYIARTLRNVGTNRHWVADLSLAGPIGHLPAGEMQWAFGLQYRRESASLVLDPQTGEGVTGEVFTPVPNPSSFNAREMFAELHAPLLRDVPAAAALDATLGARYSRYSAFGGANSLQGGLHWRMVSHVTVRGGYSHVFRAPGLGDLFSSQFVEARPIGDPCGEDPSAEQQIHCAAAGVPNGRYQSPSEPLQVVFGGNTQLVAESGNTWTAGFLLHSERSAAWVASVDYWHISLFDALESPSPFDIVAQCADTGAPDACGLITRLPDGTISQIDAREHNLTQLSVRGVDISIGARTPLRWGTMSAQLSGTWLESERVRSFDTGTPIELSGTYDSNGFSWPKRRLRGTLDWDRGGWRVSYVAQYTDSMTECGDKNFYPYLSNTDCRKIASRLYHDLSARYQRPGGLRVTAAVDNLLDTYPPRINQSPSANTDPTIYPLLGRSYSVAVGYVFH